MHNAVPHTHSDRPSHRTIRYAKHFLRSCGCFPAYEEFASSYSERKIGKAGVKRLEFCIREQCWSPDDIVGITLTEGDSTVPFPDTVYRHLSNRLRSTKAHIKETSGKVKGKELLLKAKHSACRDRNERHLNVLSGSMKQEVETRALNRETEIVNEIHGLIRESRWQNIVSSDKVLNLTVNEVGDHELEILSLGTDFKLQSGNEISLDVAVGFESYDYRHSG